MMSVWQLLTDTVARALPPDIATSLRLFHCDRDDKGRFVRFAGLARARNELLVEYYRTGACSAMLILGLFSLPEGGAGWSGMAPELGMLLRWPGIAYLPYGFTRDELIATVRKIVEGAKEPLPPGLLPTVGDIMRLTSEVRHWLENRRRNTEGALMNCESAGRGEKRLHDSYLEPVAAISEEHRAMLDRLWMLEAPAARFAPRIGGLAPLKAAIAGFETGWQALETTRAVLRTGGAEERPKSLADVVTELRQVIEALSAAIMATRDLDKDIIEQKGK
jgi:hypothetical protein